MARDRIVLGRRFAILEGHRGAVDPRCGLPGVEVVDGLADEPAPKVEAG